MEIGPFLKALETALTERGIPQEEAARHTAALGRTFTADDLKEIANIRGQTDIDKIADSITKVLYKNKISSQSAPVHPQVSQPKTAQPVRIAPQPNESIDHHAAEKRKYVQNSAEFFTPATGADKTTKGVTTFWLIFLLTLPITIALVLTVAALFACGFISIIVAIIGLLLAMIAVVAAGSAVSLVGIIYGITQLFSFVAAGLYEIGLGVIVAGIVLFSAIILYNTAIRLLPWVMKWLTVLFFFVFRKIRELFYIARKECYKL